MEAWGVEVVSNHHARILTFLGKDGKYYGAARIIRSLKIPMGAFWREIKIMQAEGRVEVVAHGIGYRIKRVI